MSEADTLTQFSAKLTEAGLLVEHIEADGQLHRCGTINKPLSKNGAYRVHLDEPASLWWQNWQTGDTGTFCAKVEKQFTASERETLKRRMAEARAERQRLDDERHAEAAQRAQRLWSAAKLATDAHPYLQKKGVACLGLRLAHDGRLIAPVMNAAGKLTSVQFINDSGEKRFLSGGQTAGGYCAIPAKDGRTDGALLIAEGYATAASLHMATGYAALVAFNAGNLLAVAEMARRLYPEREIVVCCDNDSATDGNPGLTKATAAASTIGAKLAVPPLEGRGKMDFNDLHQLRGELAVREVVQAATRRASNLCPMPSGFSLVPEGKRAGLYCIEVKPDGDFNEVRLGPPLFVKGMTRDADSNAWGLLLEWKDPDGKAHQWAMPQALLSKQGAEWFPQLADGGWRGVPAQKSKLARFLSEVTPTKRIRCVPCTGWHGGAFVLPDVILKNTAGRAGNAGQGNGHKALSPSSNESPVLEMLDKRGLYDGEEIVLQIQTPKNPFRMAGTLEGWQTTIGKWARGNSRVVLAVCASLAAPLLNVSGQESGGFNWVGQSSTGKTTALVAAASAWGRGASSGGYVQNWRATSNGLEGLAALHSDAPICLDEIGQAPGRTITEAAYMLANGMGKARASTDGSARTARSWRCMILSTGEKGLAEKIVEEGGRPQAGQTVRLIDIPADAGAGLGLFEKLHDHDTPRAFADALKLAATTHYGHAARAFIMALLNDMENVRRQLPVALSEAGKLLSPSNASGQVERVARRFALCAAAGEMATDWGIVPWQKGEAMNAVKICFSAWLALRGGAGAAEDVTIMEQIMLFIEQHGASRFQDVDRPDAPCINRVGFRRKTDTGTEFYALTESFKSEVCKGINAKRAAALLLEKGILLPGDSRSFSRRPPVDLPGFGRKRCYTLFIGGESFVGEENHDMV